MLIVWPTTRRGQYYLYFVWVLSIETVTERSFIWPQKSFWPYVKEAFILICLGFVWVLSIETMTERSFIWPRKSFWPYVKEAFILIRATRERIIPFLAAATNRSRYLLASADGCCRNLCEKWRSVLCDIILVNIDNTLLSIIGWHNYWYKRI